MNTNGSLGTGQIAIVIPVYNAESYLSECLDSLIAQTYLSWIAYCVDDGSYDTSWAILKEYAAKDNRIKIFHKKNGGASSARNYALERIGSEEWLSFVDADDFVSPNMYRAIMMAVREHDKIDYVRLYCQHTLSRYRQYCVGRLPENVSSSPSKTLQVNREDYFAGGLVGGFTHSLFVKLNVVKGNNLRFCEDMRVLEDQVFSITCATYCSNFLLLKEPRNYYYYSGNESSLTRTSNNSSDDIVRCVNRVYDAFVRMGSNTVIKNYFYGQYLPRKLDMLYSQEIHFRRKGSVKMDKDIIILKAKLSCRTMIKSIAASLIRCVGQPKRQRLLDV